MSSKLTVAEYVIRRLAELGIEHVFGVPGDYSFPIDDAIEASKKVKWIVCANELNAAYAADAYARRRGAAILTTTYGVGELSAINGMMGAKAHRVPVFHVVGAPSTRIQRQRLITHHTLGDGTFGNFFPLSAAAAGVSAEITPDNVVPELERCIREALSLSRPAFLQIAEDYAKMPVSGTPVKGKKLAAISRGRSNPKELDAAVRDILTLLKQAGKAVVLPSCLVKRYGAQENLLAFLRRSGLPFAMTPMDRGILPETDPQYLGLYNGQNLFPAQIRAEVEKADVILDVGGIVLEDLNTGMWTDSFDPERLVTIGSDFVHLDGQYFTSVMLPDVLAGLARLAPKAASKTKPSRQLLPLAGSGRDRVSSAAFYPRFQRMLQPGDNLVVETGTCMMHMNALRLPEAVGYEAQTLWGSIGWATPAALGVAIAQPGRRTILLTGDGSHQLTANEIGVMGRYGINPILFVLNNGLYGIEDALSQRGHVYDDLAKWNYHMLPAAMGCRGWFCARINTVAELEAALKKARSHKGACYLEIMIPEEESQPLPGAVLNQIYKTATPKARPH